MTVHDLYYGMVEYRHASLTAVLLCPLAIAAVAWLLKIAALEPASQAVANVGISLGLGALLVELVAITYGYRVAGANPLADVDIVFLIAPIYLVVAALAVEKILFPGKQEEIRLFLRRLALVVITFGVLYGVLSQFSFHMVVWTNLTAFLMFLVATIAILYFGVARLLR
ncbi:MAG: hypothetical protein HYV63_21620 [Candidatus Schekmanbacteria bacterium]|nr:hypothetical protein [Candidatus Schekmanbacteria bacterium]